MNKLIGVGNNDNLLWYNKPPEEKNLINNALSPEVFEKVLSYISNEELQKTRFVSSEWNVASIDTVKYEEFSHIKRFAKFLASNLSEKSYPTQREKLFNIKNNTKILNSSNLTEVKSSIYDLRKNVLNILTELNNEDLELLEESSKDAIKPQFFENIIDDMVTVFKKTKDNHYIPGEVTTIYLKLIYNNNIEEALAIVKLIPDDLKDDALRDISKELMNNSNFDKAIEIANTIQEENAKGNVLADIVYALTKIDIDKAMKITNTISSQTTRGYCLWHISEIHAKNNDIKTAIEVANTISYKGVYGSALGSIAEILARNGDFDKTYEIVKMIGDEEKEDNTLLDISKKLTECGTIDKAIEIAKKISNKINRAIAFDNISRKLTKLESTIDDINKVMKLAKALPDEAERGILFYDISMKLAKINDIDKSVETANMILNDEVRGYLFEDISSILMCNGKVDKCFEIANMIPKESSREHILCTYAWNLAQKESLDIKAVNMIPNMSIRENILMNHSYNLALKDIDAALKVANMISTQKTRESALKKILELLLKNGKIDDAKKVDMMFFDEKK